MDSESRKVLTRLVTTRLVASLGTLRDGAPNVTMVLVAPAPAVPGFYIHVSRLAHHTQDMLADPRIGLMLVDAEEEGRDPQTLARVSVLGEATEVERGSDEDLAAADLYVDRFAEADALVGMGDFGFFRLTVRSARFVGGFARAFNLRAEQLFER